MDLRYSEEYEAFRGEVQAFLKAWPLTGEDAKLSLAKREALFRVRAIEAGYVYRDIPKAYGGAGRPGDPRKDAIVRDEFSKLRQSIQPVGESGSIEQFL